MAEVLRMIKVLIPYRYGTTIQQLKPRSQAKSQRSVLIPYRYGTTRRSLVEP